MKCLSFDIAKGKSVVGLFDSEMNVIVSPHEIAHSKSSFERIARLVEKDEIEIILESTSTYHYPVVRYFENLGFRVIVINPLISKDHKRSLRKTKTDKIDCENLASIYFEKKYNQQRHHDHTYLEMQDISRHIHNLNECIVRYKNRYHQLLELVFPSFEYQMPNDKKFASNMLHFIAVFPHPDLIINTRIDKLANTLSIDSHSSYKRFLKTADKIKNLALDSISSVDVNDSLVFHLKELATIIYELTVKINASKDSLVALAKSKSHFNLICSINGISPYMTALLMAELKDFTQFKSVKQLTASCGLDPTIIQSGKSINYHGPISKRGNRHARKALFNSIINILKYSARLNEHDPIYLYYRKKRSEGKHHYASVIACTTKLLRIIFTMCKNNSLYA